MATWHWGQKGRQVGLFLLACLFCGADPFFVGSAHLRESLPSSDPLRDDDKIYFFFSESGKEFDFFEDTIVSRIARVCKVSGSRWIQMIYEQALSNVGKVMATFCPSATFCGSAVPPSGHLLLRHLLTFPYTVHVLWQQRQAGVSQEQEAIQDSTTGALDDKEFEGFVLKKDEEAAEKVHALVSSVSTAGDRRPTPGSELMFTEEKNKCWGT